MISVEDKVIGSANTIIAYCLIHNPWKFLLVKTIQFFPFKSMAPLNLAKESMDYRLRTSELTVSEVASDSDIVGFHRAG